MFTVITIKEDSRGVRWLPRWISRRGVSFHTEKVMGTSVNFIEVSSYMLDSQRIPWNKIEKVAGNYPVLLSERLVLPNGTPLSRFRIRRFGELLALNTAVFLLERCELPFYNLSLGIVDLSGTRGDLAELAVRHIPHVKIHTLHPEMLESFSRSMMDIYGAAVTLSPFSASLEDCCLLAAFDPLPSIEPADPDRIIPASFPFMVYGCTPPANSLFQAITVSLPVVPPSILPFIPCDIDPMGFLGALYEQNHCMKLRHCQPQTFSCDGVPSSLENLCMRIFNLRSGNL